MLSLLRIRNLAIVDEIEFEFAAGVNVLTGETGAGKSIVLKAIELLTGSRATGDIIRSGARQCEVEALFVLSDKAMRALEAVSEEAAASVVDREILIRRVVASSGRSKAYINHQLTTLGQLEHIAPVLLDITGQRYAHTLLESSAQRELLDGFGVPEELRQSTADAYHVYSQASSTLENFLRESDTKADYFRRLAFERDELEATSLRAGEREELDEESRRLANVEHLSDAANEARAILEERDGSIEEQLRIAEKLLGEAAKFDARLQPVVDLVRSAAVQVDEAKRELEDRMAMLEADPERLEAIRERVADIARLERKYGRNEAQLIEYLTTISAELVEFESGAFDEEKLRERVELARVALAALEQKLRSKRKEVGKKLGALVQKQLGELGMPKAGFSVELIEAASGPSGADRVEFLLAPNPGEPPKSLAKVASGGEFARVVLILKTLINEQSQPDLQVFDEIDVGVGGAIAQVVGEKLREVGKISQVVLVTHAPQIAALADTHFFIEKSTSKNTTRTVVRQLTDNERVTEIARMLAGKKISAKFEDSARELLALKP